MSGCLPLGDPAHTVFISCQMLVLIILSFPVVPPPRQPRPPSLLPLAPLPHPWRRWQPRSPSSLPLFSISHCSALSFSSTLFSHLVAAPTSSTPSSLGWLAHLGKVKSAQTPALWSFRFEMLHKVEPDVSILILAHETQEDSLTWKTLPHCLGNHHDFSADHVLGILYWRLVSCSIFPTINCPKSINVFLRFVMLYLECPSGSLMNFTSMYKLYQF